MTSLSSLDDLMVDSLQLSCAVSQTRRDHSSQLLHAGNGGISGAADGSADGAVCIRREKCGCAA